MTTFDVAARQQVYLERAKAGELVKLRATIKEAAKVVSQRLTNGELTAFSQARYERLLAKIREELAAIYGGYTAELRDDLRELAVIEKEQDAAALAALAGTADEPTVAQVFAAALARPLSTGNGTGQLLQPFIKDWSEKAVEQVDSTIRLGFFNGDTNAQIVRNIRGTKANNYKDGVLDLTYRQGSAVVQTAMQHVAQVARSEVWAANSDIVHSYEWVSTLDSRTSPTCQSLDGRVFPIGKGPLPPAHINCRSTTVPVLTGMFAEFAQGGQRPSVGADGVERVPAKTTYYEWLKTQPAAFQDDAIGPTRGALLRRGGISAEEFARLSLGRNFEPLTLEEMRQKDPLAFKRAGI